MRAGIADGERVSAEHWVVGATASVLVTAIVAPVVAHLNAWAAVLVDTDSRSPSASGSCYVLRRGRERRSAVALPDHFLSIRL